MQAMPTATLLADEEYVYIPETDEWQVQKKSGNKKLSKKDYGDSAICPSCGDWKPTDFSPEELKEREWECLDCMNKRLTTPQDLPENRGQKLITKFDPEFEWLLKLVNIVAKAAPEAVPEIKSLSRSHPFKTIDDAGDLAAQIWTLATEKYQIPREWLMKKLPEKRSSLKKAYEGGYPTENDAVYWGTAPVNTYSDQPMINHDVPTGRREGDDGEPLVICPKCKSEKIVKEGEQAKCQACGTNFYPKPDRGSDDPSINDYSQNYFWGPNDLGRSHQNQPGANGWLPAGTEDMDGPSSNVRMSSLKKKAYVEEAWVAPDGKIFPVGAEHHDEWIVLNTDILEGYDYSKEELEPLNNLNIEDLSTEDDDLIGYWFEKLIRDGWVRLNEGSGKSQFVIHVNDITHLPPSLDEIVSENFNPNDKRPIEIGTHDRHISIYNPFPNIQNAVNKSLRQPAMSSFKSFMHKQSSLNKLAHCGPCSVLKMEALHILIDLYYKDNNLFPQETIEDLSLAATELKLNNFDDILESVITEYLEEKAEKVGDKLPKLKNLLIALKDIAPKLGNEIEVVDKQESVDKEAAQEEYPKISKPKSGYVDNGIGYTCGRCEYFNPEREKCKKVEGTIKSFGCCNFWDGEGKFKEKNKTAEKKELETDKRALTKEEAVYVQYPNVDYRCDECTFFNAEDKKCTKVDGEISPTASCNFWQPIKNKQANLNKQSNPPSRFWIAPDGKEFDASTHHGAWIDQNKPILKQYGIDPARFNNLSEIGHEMYVQGWSRVSNEPAGAGFQIQVNDPKHLPPYLDDFIAKNFSESDKIIISNREQMAEITNPFPSIQKAVNRELQPIATWASQKQASLLDEVLDQTTQDAIAAEYGPQMLVALRFYNDAVRYGQDPQRSMSYALEETRRMKRPIEQTKFLEVLNTYF